jgi:hypothetical protein
MQIGFIVAHGLLFRLFTFPHVALQFLSRVVTPSQSNLLICNPLNPRFHASLPHRRCYIFRFILRITRSFVLSHRF